MNPSAPWEQSSNSRRNDYSRARTCSPGLNSGFPSSSSSAAPRSSTRLPPIQSSVPDPRYPAGMGTLHPSRPYDTEYNVHHQPSSMFVDSRYSTWGPSGGGGGGGHHSARYPDPPMMSSAFNPSTPSYGYSEPRYSATPAAHHSSGMHRPRPSMPYMQDPIPSHTQPRYSINYDYPPAISNFPQQGRQLPPPYPIDTYISNSSIHQGSPPGDGGDWTSSPTGSMASPISPHSSYGLPFVDGSAADPNVKKKRKRADARQLSILNGVYERTAFPSTEERRSLATQLDMTPRSVQIWFQNKRQANKSRPPPPPPSAPAPVTLQRPPSRMSPSSNNSYSGGSEYGPSQGYPSRSPPTISLSGYPTMEPSSRARSLSREREYIPPPFPRRR